MPVWRNERFSHIEAGKKVLAYDDESISIYNTEEKKLNDANIIFVHSASIVYKIPGVDILWDGDNMQTIIAKRKNYDNRGRLDNSDGTAIFLDGNLFDRLRFAKSREDEPEYWDMMMALSEEVR